MLPNVHRLLEGNRSGQTPSPVLLSSVPVVRSWHGKRRAETVTSVLDVPSPKRRTLAAESSVEPRVLCTNQCFCPTLDCSIKMCSCKEINVCSFTHPGLGPRTQSHMLQNIKIMNTNVLDFPIVPTLDIPSHLCPQEGAAAPQVEQVFSKPLLGQVQTENVPSTVHTGPLAPHKAQWEKCGASSWVLKTITKGYRLQFAAAPPGFSGVMHSLPREREALILEEEIKALKHKGAIRIVPPEQSQAGFYSRYFLVPKKGGGLRPILDLRALNKFLRIYTFRMLTHTNLVRFVRQGDWFVSIDLKDAYFHIPIYPPHRKYLRFAFRGVVYEYTVLPFGLSLSPRVFVKCTEAALAPLRKRGLRLATYLDDWLLAAQCPRQLQVHARQLLSHLAALGFTVNRDKSVLVPSQSIEFIGLHLDSVAFKARLSADRVKALLACLATFRRGAMLRFRTCLRLLGLMASALVVVPLGRLYMRPFQRWVAGLCLNPSRHRHRSVFVTADCVRVLRPWRRETFLTGGVAMGTVTTRKVITTDASLRGWGATHEGRSVRGAWNSQMKLCHINYLELQAVWMALRHFLPFISGQNVLIRTDNTTVVAYVNKQGGLRSHQLHMLAHRLIVWASSHVLSLRATHVPGVLNRGADLLSRGSPRYKDWKLHSGVVAQIWEIYGTAEVDLFASREDAQRPLYYSLADQSAPLGMDALAHKWPRSLLYAFPPLELISPTLSRVREEKHSLILVAPYWPARYWMAEISQLLCSRPWPLPLRRDLVTQAHGEIFHPHPERLALWAWPVKG